ncbi:MAG: hypothetical protein MUC36_09695 [Planctomycetes bacterium]|jgi:hypothetical protein|nr:hypothetical protein [Planctomycetota bacterium]
MCIHRRLFSALLVAAIWLLGACSSVRHIRDAQDSFNRAAQVEFEESQLDAGHSADAVATGPTAAREYTTALALLRRELRQNADELAADKLTGTALLLEALCVWRLESLGQLERNTSGFLQTMTRLAEHRAELGTRDRVLSLALPGLRENDQGFENLSNDPVKARELFESAYAVLDRAIEVVKPHDSHPIHAFVRVSQLRVCANWKQAIEADRKLADHEGKMRIEDVRKKLCESWKSIPSAVAEAQRSWLTARAFEVTRASGWQVPCAD